LCWQSKNVCTFHTDVRTSDGAVFHSETLRTEWLWVELVLLDDKHQSGIFHLFILHYMEAYYAHSVYGLTGKGKGKDKSFPVHNYTQSYEDKGGVDI